MLRDAIKDLQALATEAKQQGLVTAARKIQAIVDDLIATQEGLDMGPFLGGSPDHDVTVTK